MAKIKLGKSLGSYKIDMHFTAYDAILTYGMLVGTPAVMVELWGGGRFRGIKDLERFQFSGAHVINQVAGLHKPWKIVYVAGNEPLLQPGVFSLVDELRESHGFVAVETTGCIRIENTKHLKLPSLWVVVPPVHNADMLHDSQQFILSLLQIRLPVGRYELVFNIKNGEEFRRAVDYVAKLLMCGAECAVVFQPSRHLSKAEYLDVFESLANEGLQYAGEELSPYGLTKMSVSMEWGKLI